MTSIDDLVQEYGSRSLLWNHLFSYSDGNLFWKNPRAPRVKRGDLAGQFNARYWSCNVCGKRVYIHRIVYEMHFGDTQLEVDHIDRNTQNNAIENLRAVTRKQNIENTGTRVDNISGFKGVSYHKASKSWVAQPVIEGKRKWIGGFNSAEDAHKYLESIK